MTRRHHRMNGDASHIVGHHRSFPIASGELTDAEIAMHYGGVIVEAMEEFVVDPAYLSDIVLSANRIETRKKVRRPAAASIQAEGTA